jgi:nucleoid-associated protein YgaU
MGATIQVGSRGGIRKAKLTVVEGTIGGGAMTDITFGFNPENCTVKGGARWDVQPAKAAKHSAPPHYSGADSVSLSMSVLFDESEDSKGDVSKYVDTLLAWTRPTTETLGAGKVPAGPLLSFEWGSNPTFAGFKCVLTSVSAQYTMFLPSGVPIRAMVSLTLQQVPDDFQRQNPTSGAILGRSAHTVSEGDSLQSISYAQYGDPNFWRALAAFNHLDDPFQLEPGTSLLIPSRPEAQRISAPEGAPA